MVGLFKVAQSGINRLTTVLCGLLLTTLIVVSVLQVVYRYVLMQPAIWTEEAARHLLVWLTFLAAGIAMREGMHPRVTVLESRLPGVAKRYVRWAVVLLIASFLLVFTVVTWRVAVLYGGYTSLGTGLPQSVARMALPIGAVMMLVNVLSLLAPPDIDYELSRAVEEDAASGTGTDGRVPS